MSRFNHLLSLPSKIFTQPTFEITQKQFRTCLFVTGASFTLLYLTHNANKEQLDTHSKLYNKSLDLQDIHEKTIREQTFEINKLKSEVDKLKNANQKLTIANAIYESHNAISKAGQTGNSKA